MTSKRLMPCRGSAVIRRRPPTGHADLCARSANAPTPCSPHLSCHLASTKMSASIRLDRPGARPLARSYLRTNTGALDQHLQPTVFRFQRQTPALPRCHRFRTEAGASDPGELLGSRRGSPLEATRRRSDDLSSYSPDVALSSTPGWPGPTPVTPRRAPKGPALPEETDRCRRI